MKTKLLQPIKVGIDFDGVLAYNPLRIIRAPITLVKRTFGHQTKTKFYIPKTALEKFLFWIPHECSVFPAIGTEYLRQLVDEGSIEAHLISGRYSYLHERLNQWLVHNNLWKTFTSIHANDVDEQPHEFKQKMIRKLGITYFIEDNLDIVEYLTQRTSAKILWVYNIIDQFHSYPHKFPHLREALKLIKEEEEVS